MMMFRMNFESSNACYTLYSIKWAEKFGEKEILGMKEDFIRLLKIMKILKQLYLNSILIIKIIKLFALKRIAFFSIRIVWSFFNYLNIMWVRVNKSLHHLTSVQYLLGYIFSLYIPCLL